MKLEEKVFETLFGSSNYTDKQQVNAIVKLVLEIAEEAYKRGIEDYWIDGYGSFEDFKKEIL